jgi:hypothetical protein
MELSVFTKRCYPRAILYRGAGRWTSPPPRAMDGQGENVLETPGVLVGEPRAVHGNAMQCLANQPSPTLDEQFRPASEDGPFLQQRYKTPGGGVGMYPSARTHASQGEADAATRQSNQRHDERPNNSTETSAILARKQAGPLRSTRRFAKGNVNVMWLGRHGKIGEDGIRCYGGTAPGVYLHG